MANESKLIKKIQSGNIDLFSELYEEYVDKIYRYIYYKTHHKETAEDITSQTFFKALENINTYNEEKGSFSSWIYRIAGNSVIDHYRTEKKVQNIEDVWDLADKKDIEFDTDTKIKVNQIKEHLSKFKADQRDIIILRVFEDLPFKEISEISGKSEANCKMIFKRGLTKLQKLFNQLKN